MLRAVFKEGRTASAQYDIELEGAHIHRQGGVHVQRRDEALNG
ncbi:hypothetical protein P865_00730 [Brucella abortus 82]|nr:hypothetical protein P865_00730 [Brucella abortus 82]